MSLFEFLRQHKKDANCLHGGMLLTMRFSAGFAAYSPMQESFIRLGVSDIRNDKDTYMVEAECMTVCTTEQGVYMPCVEFGKTFFAPFLGAQAIMLKFNLKQDFMRMSYTNKAGQTFVVDLNVKLVQIIMGLTDAENAWLENGITHAIKVRYTSDEKRVASFMSMHNLRMIAQSRQNKCRSQRVGNIIFNCKKIKMVDNAFYLAFFINGKDNHILSALNKIGYSMVRLVAIPKILRKQMWAQDKLCFCAHCKAAHICTTQPRNIYTVSE